MKKVAAMGVVLMLVLMLVFSTSAFADSVELSLSELQNGKVICTVINAGGFWTIYVNDKSVASRAGDDGSVTVSAALGDTVMVSAINGRASHVVGGDPVMPPAIEADIRLTPSMNNPSASMAIKVGRKITVEVTNSSMSQGYTFAVNVSAPEVVSVSQTELFLEKNEEGILEIEGLESGKATVQIITGDGYSARKATISLTVGNGIAPSSKAQFKLPGGLREIEEEAFSGAPIKSVLIPAGVAKIGAKAFMNCRQLEVVYFEGTRIDIAENAFDGCSSVIFVCGADSDAQRYAAQHGFEACE